jgi:hypothetical protein
MANLEEINVKSAVETQSITTTSAIDATKLCFKIALITIIVYAVTYFLTH